MNLGCKLSRASVTDSVTIQIKPSIPKSYNTPAQLGVQDQGSTNKCVAYSLYEILHYRGRLTNIKPRVSVDDIYSCREEKGDNGMNVKEGLKYLKSKGQIKTFGKLTSVNFIPTSLIANGPAVIVLPAYDNSGVEQFWVGSGTPLGYHAVALVGYRPGSFIIKNSWGTSYAQRGYAELPISDAEKYIKEIWIIIN